MGFLDRVASGVERRSLSALSNPAGWLIEALGGPRTFSGHRVNVGTAMGLSAVFSAVSYISGGVLQCPLKVYRDQSDGTTDEAVDHRAWMMLHDKPNPLTPAAHHWAATTANVLLWGNSFQEKVRGSSGLVEELWLLEPERMMVLWDPLQRVKRFEYTYADGRKRIFSEEEILHIFDLSLDGVVGLSRIGYCRNMLGTAIAREEFEGGFYARGGTYRGVIEHPDKIGEEGVRNMRQSWTAVFGGSGNAHQTPVLEEGAKFNSISMPLEDMQFIESQQSTRTDIAVMFKLPPSYLGGSTGDSLTYATVEGNQIQFAQHAVAGPTTAIAKAVSADTAIFPFQSWYCEFVLEGLMRGDHGARADFYQKMFALKDGEGRRALSVNEIRAKENLPDAVKEKAPAPPPALEPPADQKPLPDGVVPLPQLTRGTAN